MKRVRPLVLVLVLLIMPCILFAQQEKVTRTVTTNESSGMISEFSPDTIMIRTETSSSPIRYGYTKNTTYIDDTGAPVSMEAVRSGLPVRIFYTEEGDRMIAEKVVIRRTTTTTGSPGMEEKQTTTTSTTTQGK